MTDAQSANKSMCLIRCLLLTLVVLLSVLLVASEDGGQTATVDHHCISVSDCLKSGKFLDQLIEENAQFKAALQDQVQQLRELSTDLNYALNGLRELTGQTTLTTPTTSISTRPHQTSHLITVIPDISTSYQFHDFVLFGGKLYSLNGTHRGFTGLKVHDALNGSFIGTVTIPAEHGDRRRDPHLLAVCHRKSQIYMSTLDDIWYANITQLEPNSDAPWQKLTWYKEMHSIRPRFLWSIALSDDCDKVFLIYLSDGVTELEIRRVSDGDILISRNNWTGRIHDIVGTNQRYYISQSDKNNSCYVVEYNNQLKEVRRIGKALQGSEENPNNYKHKNDTYCYHVLALHEDGGIFVSTDRVIFVWPNFTSFVEVAPSNYFESIYYDPQLKLLGAMAPNYNNEEILHKVNVYNITLI